MRYPRPETKLRNRFKTPVPIGELAKIYLTMRNLTIEQYKATAHGFALIYGNALIKRNKAVKITELFIECYHDIEEDLECLTEQFLEDSTEKDLKNGFYDFEILINVSGNPEWWEVEQVELTYRVQPKKKPKATPVLPF